jgi:hypothetical protein
MAFVDDRATLVQILNFVEKLLDELVPLIPATEDQEQFVIAWNSEVRPALGELRTRILTVASPTDPRWLEIQQRGLSGEQLKLKRARLAAASKKGIRKKILDIINTILGSIPGADPIKEFKEFTEEALPDDDGNSPVSARFS